jgi:hypothetical protein
LTVVGAIACRVERPAGSERVHGRLEPRAATGAPQATAEVVWDYEVHAGGWPALALRIDARFAATAEATIDGDDAARPFVHGVEYDAQGEWRPAPRRDDGAWVTPCHADPAGCRVHYAISLGEAATRIDDVETAWAGGGLVVAPPSTWLLRPAGDPKPGARFRFRVIGEPGVRFATGVRPSPDGAADSFEAQTAAIDSVTFAVFGPFRVQVVTQGKARIEVVSAPSGLALGESGALAWVKSATDGIANYYESFPAAHTLIVIAPGYAPVTRGETLGDGGPAIVVRAASGFEAGAIRDDWVVTHELVHATLPTLGRAHAWLEEGIATYVEPIVRVRAGLLSESQYWHDLIEGIPQGLPQPGDEGLERTHTWGRTYWGGALFCLVADVRIREATGDARSFDDALRGIAGHGVDVESHWSIERFIDAGDRATGTTVLTDLYRTLALAPGTIELAKLWARLGVRPPRVRGQPVTFDDTAPLAAIRRAITRPQSPDAHPVASPSTPNP